MKNRLLKIIFVIILFLMFIFFSSYSYAKSVFQNLSSSIFRLHIIANSDSEKDQELKLKVRDNIIHYLKDETKNCKTKEEVMKFISSNIKELQKIAIQTIKENGYDYNVELKIGNFYFPTKYYGNISMPSGNYDALRIEIGDAKGKNWWCSLFPALCFTDVSNGKISKDAKNLLQKNLGEEEVDILLEKTPKIRFKFKLIELLNK